MRRVALATALMLAVLVLPAATALAQQCPRTTLGDIEDEVMCPVCGTPLSLASEAPQAEREIAFIEREIADCRSKPEIKRALVAEFGESVLALPGDESGDDDLEDLLVYLIPALVIILAAGGIAFAVMRWRGRRPGRERSTESAASADRGRLDADMERYDL